MKRFIKVVTLPDGTTKNIFPLSEREIQEIREMPDEDYDNCVAESQDGISATCHDYNRHTDGDKDRELSLFIDYAILNYVIWQREIYRQEVAEQREHVLEGDASQEGYEDILRKAKEAQDRNNSLNN